jgi:phosphonopyruvate decarboxylase
MMKRVDAIELLAATKGADGVSVTTMRSIPDWYDTGAATERHIDNIGCMGGAAPLALGLALSQPERQVMVVDGDGSLLMQLGVLASIAEAAPANLYHVVLVNGIYETSGMQPTPSADKVDFAAIALGAGYRQAYTFDDVAVLRERLPGILGQPGPAMLALKVEPVAIRRPTPAERHKDPAGWLRENLAGA